MKTGRNPWCWLRSLETTVSFSAVRPLGTHFTTLACFLLWTMRKFGEASFPDVFIFYYSIIPCPLTSELGLTLGKILPTKLC